MTDENLIVGAEHFSDGGVYRVTDDLAIVQTIDFFPPVVDDPFIFGQIAAANALSDLYAMGARPRTALNVVGFPDKELDLSILSAILAGGAERVQRAGAVIIGGHSVRDAEIKYGLCVTGFVNPAHLITNDHAEPGHLLILTKALGTGFITTANRAGDCDQETLDAACRSMIMLNDVASRAAVQNQASAATDITGYAIAGHAYEMAHASAVNVELAFSKLPRLHGVEECAAAGNRTRAHKSNREHVQARLDLDAAVAADPMVDLLFDPQTSGGLLMAVPPGAAGEVIQQCRAAGLTYATIVGKVLDPSDYPRLKIVP